MVSIIRFGFLLLSMKLSCRAVTFLLFTFPEITPPTTSIIPELKWHYCCNHDTVVDL